ncbi:MAG: transglycosylase SLT domain-containing protein [Desulfobacteraceae bacterium]|jgi:hypothetical protein
MTPTAIFKNRYPVASILWIAISILACPATEGRPLSLFEGLDLPDSITFCGESVPLSDARIRERLEKEMLLALWDRPQVLLWIKRAPRYFPHIAKVLNTQNMPDDLKYLAVAESALRPHAGSTKGAIGFWQLLPDTARKYGLTVDPFIDERRNLFSSTPAALRYLKELHGKFSSWTLAAAAYNMGEQGLTAEILEQRVKDYYRLYLPLETQRFVFRVIAVKLILSEPQRYGFKLSPDKLYKPFVFDNAHVDCFQEIPLQLVAEAAGSYFKEIKDLNPHLRGHYLRAGHHQILLPVGRSEGFQTRLNKLISQYARDKQKRLYIVKSGDSLSTIAEKFDVPLAALIIWNRIDHRRPIHPGDRLVIYPRRLDQIKP